ncbi:LpxI family protein [Phenylobacterium sp.]|uniref:UDP-2,3-diacylglucosamine diphosphatase n=1 Tax=Phenylobacterium sp. TaxID=1871053 RepID=UPI0027342666|nr:UDP-2,3-diacylglucosamine diphosphatase LpxI [Phenylobacterium sp.]MDP3172896.1 UDP-2,3-diacylglucosamine diphosphatase LpxI [Phenylobacterium sp.]MDP3660085.1 UDP-2,3-diacylglucosamine diphosphatase LpxI [Phenylobacterium sp.]
MRKLGLIAGGGGLPVEIAEHCEQAGRPLFVMRLKGFAGPALAEYPGADVGLAEFGKCFEGLRRAGVESVCMAGAVSRPDFRDLKPDWRGLMYLPGAIAAARKGDDALLRFVVGAFEKEGFAVEGAHQVMDDLTLGAGPLGAVVPDEAQLLDAQRALHVAREVGRMDVGQGCVVCDGLVLAVEAQEGTDAMLARVAQLPPAIRGGPGAARGVLAKAPKPAQEARVDLPTIGLGTVQAAARAGLAGVVGEAGHLLVLDREEVIALADELGVFIFGVEPLSA